MTRYYDPTTGQFISPDGFDYLKPETVGLVNLYVYCGYDPINKADPNGEVFILSIIIGAVAGAISSAVVSIATQVISGEEVDWGEVGVAAFFGAISGAVAATGLGVFAQFGINTGLSFFNYTINSINNGDFSFEGVINSLVVGGLSCLAGGNGARFVQGEKALWEITNATSKIVARTLKSLFKSNVAGFATNYVIEKFETITE